MEGFQSFFSFKNYVNIFTMFLRFKKYTDCRRNNSYKNGNSRLQITGVNTEKIDWFVYGQKKQLAK